jgi:YD repeat-containing protein
MPTSQNLRCRSSTKGWVTGVARWLVLAMLPCCTAWAATQYLYDDLGRLVLTANGDGSSIVYEHDENGNLVAVHQSSTAGPIVAGFSPAYGYAGLPITILGNGFDTDPGSNAVTIGGVTATVTAATATTLSSVIPSGATTGPISVTVDGLTATSTQSLVVLLPNVSSFSPTLVAPGDSVTVTGNNLDLVPGTALSVGAASVTITSISNTEIVFTAPSNTGGPIVVDTSYGQASSASPLHIVPAALALEDVVDSADIELDGAAEIQTIGAAGKTALYWFDGTADDYLSVQVDSLSISPSNGWVGVAVYDPSGAAVAGVSMSTTTPQTLHLPKLTATGKYLLTFDSLSNTSVQVAARVESNPLLDTTNGTTVSASTTAPMQGKRFVMNATAGEDLGIAITGLALTPSSPNYVRLWVYDASGAYVQGSSNCLTTTVPGCSVQFMDMPQTGPYTVVVDPIGASTMSFGMTAATALTGTLSLGEPLSVDIAAPGRFAQLSFSPPLGQPTAINLDWSATAPAGETVDLRVYDPSGTLIQWFIVTEAKNLSLANPSSGTYTLLVAPQEAAQLQATATLDQTFTGWNDSAVPSTPAVASGTAVELGVKFKTDFDGLIKGLRFYKGSGNDGTHVGNLWTSAGSLLASATFTNETATGWQEVEFATPVTVTANTVYVASYYAPQGHFAYTGSYFSYASLDAGPLHLLQNGVSGGNAVYAYSGSSTFPSSNGGGANYWVDVVYEFQDTTPPTVTAVTPVSDTTVASTEATVKAFLDEAADPATISGSTFELEVTGGATVSATVSYDAATRAAVLVPDEALAALTSYTATLTGGAQGVHDTSGNALGADYTWSFTTAAGPSYTVWPDTEVPANPADPNSSYYELGVKFTVDTDGYVTGVRFYKGAGNGGTHVGNLWSASGTLLASATFTNESATGWQQVEFSTPAAVTANTVYVVSYYCPQGHFAFSNGLFASSGVDAAPIHLLQNGVSGYNSVFAASTTSAFPTSTYNASYYWVDLVFVPSE